VTDLQFGCDGVRVDRYGAAPTLLFDLRLRETTGARVHAILLRVQVRIEATRRTYDDEEATRLLDLFGERPRWGETLTTLQLANLSVAVPGFAEETAVELAMPVTYDLELAPTRYLHALGEGDAPLLLLFSGTVFYLGEGGVQVAQVPWDREVRVRLPAALWRELVDLYWPGQSWLRLRTETLDELARFKNREALTTFDEVVQRLLEQASDASTREPA
jgi:hypothetical protein